ncbi:hypothetical protein [uncultured Winogradskyella sp.]|uniref:hypothetical protein n=1 Tax=uncultured Winogradskyella sp. TaxID=395353 RepID=UPI0026217B93|nr:hypothetical protein [uncultured Winogradskyella sp.]
MSCEKKKAELDYNENGFPIITNSFKLDFIKEFLNDTSLAKYKRYSEPYVFMVNDDNKIYTITENSKIQNLTKTDYISLKLKIQDISFIYEQLSEDLKNENLIAHGLRSLNWDKLVDYHFENTNLGIEYFVSQDSIAKVEESLKDNGILYLSTPIFNKTLDLAFMDIEGSVTGETIIFKKIEDRWSVKEITNEWIR